MPTLEEVFARHRTWIAECEDLDALMDKLLEWQEDERVGERRGQQLLRMRARDLVELARRRLVRLKADAIRAEDENTRRARTPPVPDAVQPRAGPERAGVGIDASANELAKVKAELEASRVAQRQAERERAAAEALAVQRAGAAAAAQRAASESAKAVADQRAVAAAQDRALTERLAVPVPRSASPRTPGVPASSVFAARQVERPAQPAHPLAVAAREGLDLRRSQPGGGAAAPASPAARAPTTSREPAPPSPAPRVPPASPRASPTPSTRESDLARAITEAIAAKHPAVPPAFDLATSDREALESAGRYPIPGPTNPKGPWRPDDEWPEEWTLTGYDLAMFRGRVRVTQKVLAGQLGVEQGTISKAEAAPKSRLGPTLQVALRRALDDLRNSPDRPRREPS